MHVFFFGDDVIEFDHRVRVVDVDFRTQGGFKVEVHVVLVLKVVGLLLLKVAERVTDEVEVVVEDIFVEVVGDQLVQFFHFCAGAIHALDHAHRHHSGTETGNIGLAPQLFQCVVDVFFIVCLLDSDFDGDQVFSFCGLCDIHF